MTEEPIFDAELAGFLQSGIAIHVGSAAALVPQLTRAAGCRVSPDRRIVTVFVDSAASTGLLEILRAKGAIAAVFTKPKSHRTVQLKGSEARISTPEAADLALVRQQVEAFSAELASIGFPPRLGQTIVGGREAHYVALSFVPTSAFVQTPGPSAGTALKSP